MKNKPIIFAAVASALIFPAVLAAPTPPTPAKTPAQVADIFPTTCPVNGESIEVAGEAAGKSVYQGRTYYFCCEKHKTEFDEDPAKYVKPAALKTAAPVK